METIISGMTPSQFVSAVNNNFEGIGDDVTTAVGYVTTINSNFSVIDSAYGTTSIDIVYGIKGSQFVSDLNDNFNESTSGIVDFLMAGYTNALENDGDVSTSLTSEETSALETLLTGLKNNNMLLKFKAIYPFMGTTVYSAKYNLIDARDLDAAFRLTWHGLDVENDTIVLNGMDTKDPYGDTHIVVDDDLTKTDMHWSYYSCEDILGSNVVSIGANKASPAGNSYMQLQSPTNKFFAYANNQTRVDSDALANTIGHFIMNVKDSKLQLFKDGVNLKEGAYVGAGSIAAGLSLYIFSRNDDGSPTAVAPFKTGLITFGDGLSATEVTAFNTLVQDFITTLGRYDTYDYDLLTLVDNGTFTPATSTNQYLTKYRNFGLGGLIHFSMYTFRYAWDYLTQPSLFNLTNVDVDTWVAKAADAGIDHLGLTIYDSSGFALFDNPINRPDYLLNKCWGLRKYDVGVADADTQIVDKFFTACQSRGIEPIPYLCPVSDLAIYFGRDFTARYPGTYDATDKQYFDNYIAKVLQYIITTWSPNYVWLDVAGQPIPTMNIDVALYYNAIKSVKSTCQIISNNVGDVNSYYYPYDIASNEEYYTPWPPMTWDVALATSRVHDGTTYFIPAEIVSNILNGGIGASWYWNNQGNRTSADIQTIYNIAKTYSANFMLSLAPNRNGQIEDAQFNVFKGLV